MSNRTPEVNTSYSNSDENSVSDAKNCELQTDNIVTVTSNGKQEKTNKWCDESPSNSNVWPDIKLSIGDLSDKNPEFLLATIKELHRRIEYTEKMNWLCELSFLNFNV